MFYKLINTKRNEWFASTACTVRPLLDYIVQHGAMRDVQVEAIKSYLYLKIACSNRPLWSLFAEGTFNTPHIDDLPLTAEARRILKSNKAATALLEYSMLKDKNGKQLAPLLEQFIKEHTADINYEEALHKIFYEVDYTDYLFSLPMGAGKTYLMAAFIYIDLYFALNEPDNPCFAHNFMIFAPSGLKSSIVPSLKKILEFDPAWVIPEPTATQLRKLVRFEILDEQKSASKSNRIKNPNAQKINNHQPLEQLMGLVAITNAEKVILDRIDKRVDSELLSEEENAKIKVANELRHIIGKLPNLSIIIDEVHHVADEDIKLRQVVNEWTRTSHFNSVLGFSGTPYLEKAKSVMLANRFAIKNTDISNVVYHYPLIKGIGNFLKSPVVKYADSDTDTIVRNGVQEFLDKYSNLIYKNGTCAKLAIYCGQIETLEDSIYPQVAQWVSEGGMNPADVILKYHGGNKSYPQPEGSEAKFATLDTPASSIRIVLLVQIGKEGWDCKSLTGVILPQKGVCPTNMVLQTSCRCLRQVEKMEDESALIWMNKFNADTLNKQLKQQQNISLNEFNKRGERPTKTIERFSRMEQLQVPPIDFYQLRVSYQTLLVDKSNDVAKRLNEDSIAIRADISLAYEQDLEGKLIDTNQINNQELVETTFNGWLQLIAKESFGTLRVSQLYPYTERLKQLFAQITFKQGDVVYADTNFNQSAIRSLIRQAFTPRRTFEVKEEVVSRQASLLQIEKLTSLTVDEYDNHFYPTTEVVNQILEWDDKPIQPEPTAEVLAALQLLEAQGYRMPDSKDPHPERERTYHYLPYRFDSGLEIDYFMQSLTIDTQGRKLELYFNGDDTLTEFKIDCYKSQNNSWRYIGKYVPDFLMLSRTETGEIHKIIIIETKGEGFAAKFADKRRFMEAEFIGKNNQEFGYNRFDFLYLEDTLSKEERTKRTIAAINQFFND